MLNFIMAASVAASVFNLNCSGTKVIETWEGLKRSPISEEPVIYVIRVDLARRLWCSGPCTTTSPIAAVDDSTIIFQRQKDSDEDQFTMVNRRTGELTERDRIFIDRTSTFMTRTTAQCERTQFSGFPAHKF